MGLNELKARRRKAWERYYELRDRVNGGENEKTTAMVEAHQAWSSANEAVWDHEKIS